MKRTFKLHSTDSTVRKNLPRHSLAWIVSPWRKMKKWCSLENRGNSYLVIQSDLFGMVKWPFQGVKWPPTRGWKGHFESPGTCFFLKATGFAVFFVGFKLMEMHEIPQRRVLPFPGNLIVDVELVQMFPKLSQYWRNSGRCYVFNQNWVVVSNIFLIFIPIWGRFPIWLIFFIWFGSTTS